jgi:hypothetical protein
MNTGNNLATIPPGLSTADLTTAINDRLRRIPASAIATTATTSKTVSQGGGPAEASEVNYGTHAQRKAAPIASFEDGALWYETDRTLWYQIESGGSASSAWKYTTGIMFAAIASRPADLAANDAGFLFQDTTPGSLYQWSGSAWVVTALGGASVAGFPGSYVPAVSLTGQTGAIGSTNLQHASAVLPAGQYLVAAYFVCTATGSGAVTVKLGWTDPGGASPIPSFGPVTLTAGNQSSQTFVAQTDGVHNLAYSTTDTGTGTYSLYITVLRMN